MKTPRFILTCLFLLLSFLQLSAQGVKNYEAEWARVNDLINKRNLPKTALEEVKNIYAMAKRDRQDAQIIKALVYMVNLQQENREDNLKSAIRDIEKEISQQKEPAASILKSYGATLYWQYFQNHRWQLYNRTNTTNFDKEDIATWTMEDFHKKIGSLYLESLRNEKLLKQTTLAPFNAIIIQGNVRQLRPTLYDLLAHKALDYFRNNERDINKPVYSFTIDQPEAFAPAEAFVKIRFPTRDSLSLQHKALLIYQELIAFHLGDAKPDALIDVDLDRLQFLRQNATVENKEELYIKALEAITSKYRNHPAAAQAWYLIALHHHELASRYQPFGDSTYRLERLKAKDILEKVVRDSSVRSEGWVNSYNLINEISKNEFSFEVEKVNVPGQAFRALVRYRNMDLLHFRLVAATEELKGNLQRMSEEKYWSSLKNATPIRSWKQALPLPNDLLDHSVEIKVDALPLGEYILLASPDPSFTGSKSSGAQMFYVSNISYVNRGNDFFVLHRETGQPLKNAAVELYVQEYNYNTSRYTKRKEDDYKTDKNGFFSVQRKAGRNERGYVLNISHEKDRLFLLDPIYNYYYEGDQRQNISPKRVFFFTDRSIYRPGQTVYFKGIVLETNKEQNSIAPNYTTTIYLRNANNEISDSLKLTTNEFGSLNGKFTLPQNLLNGQFAIEEKQSFSRSGFSVEEYKRPKFYVSFEKIAQTYKAGDVIRLTGTAKAYAGNNIEDAKVVYRVVRQPRFIYHPWTWRIWPPQGEPMEIAHGTALTDKAGKFLISFTAVPDKKIDRKLDPVFDYRIYADVTDINGETRSAENRVTAGYKSLLLKLEAPERISSDSLQSISVRTENMNGAYQKSSVTLTFYPLIPEQRLVRKRYWQQPDQFAMSKEEFIRNFPNDEYYNETDYKTWKRANASFSQTDTTSSDGRFNLKGAKPEPGFYVVEAITKDKDGNEVKNTRFIEIYNAKTRELNRPEYLWSKGSRPIEPGEKTSVEIGSSAKDIFLVQQTDRSKNRQRTTVVPDLDFSSLSNERKAFEFGATEADRGGYGVSFFFVKDNRFYQFNDVIQVPWTNKELKIEFATFRDKTLPGSEEKWKIKLSGYKNETVAAEMLASMYDASLDQFRPHSWLKPGIWPVYAMPFTWNGMQNFISVQSLQVYRGRDFYRSFDKNYDRLIFGDMHGVMYETVAVRRSMSAPPVTTAMGQAKGVGVTGNQSMQDASLQEVAADIKEEGGLPGRQPAAIDPAEVQVRRNFNETAFFFPELRTDKDGNIEFSFTAPEALTRWKLQAFSHTKELAFGLAQKEILTQKELMVQPNLPRFLRQGDQVVLSTKIVNLSTRALPGQAMLQLKDATTNEILDARFLNTSATKSFNLPAGGAAAIDFTVTIPPDFTGALTVSLVAKANADGQAFRDGEEMVLPVLTNKVLVTETMPLPMRGSGSKAFKFDKLLQSGNSNSLQQHALTVEYTSNPAWYAVQALPYLAEPTNESVEQTWNRYYANSLASKIVNAAPRIRQIFERWKTMDTAALLSNLQKNQELKSALLEETPWVLAAKTETEQKKNIAMLFDMVKMNSDLKSAFQKIKSLQSPNGGFVWFQGGPDDRYMTQYVVTGIGHLRKLDAVAAGQDDEMNSLLRTAIPYLDRKIREDYDNLIKNKANLEAQQPNYIQVQYLYMRSFFPDIAIPQSVQTAYNYYRTRAFRTWTRQNKYMQGMIALALHRSRDLQTPVDILRSLKETAIHSEEMGMYWQDQRFGFSWYWWYAPIETQALLIEAFTEIAKDTKTADDMRTWLIKHKQTNNWHSTKATAEAVYAFLLRGTDWLSAEPMVQVKLGSYLISGSQQKSEAGTGYFKQTIGAKDIKPSMGDISVTVQQPTGSADKPINLSTTPSWGAVYWQYFEDMDKVSSAATPLQLSKKLFIETNTDRGPVLTPLTDNSRLKVGDKIKVRIELRSDRDMEYVHMKDMRASAFEPVNVISGYRWQGGLGYYETTKDLSTSFFFHYLPKGTYVFEYPLFVTHAGSFSNGITTIQSMYAPEFSSHSEGVRVKVQ